MLNLNRRFFALGIAALVVAGCSSDRDIAAAEAAVARFRDRMAAQDFTVIYAESGDDLRRGISEQDLTKFLAAVVDKLGTVKTSEKATWNVNVGTSGTFITLGYKTEFANGAGAEQFIYRVKDGMPFLYRYDINAPAILVN